jgi:hypothetical protein
MENGQRVLERGYILRGRTDRPAGRSRARRVYVFFPLCIMYIYYIDYSYIVIRKRGAYAQPHLPAEITSSQHNNASAPPHYDSEIKT